MSLAPSLFASPALGSVRERSGSQQAPDSHRQSPFGGYASPPPGGAFGASFGEPRRRRAPEGATPLGNGLASPRHAPRSARSPGPPTASLLDEQLPKPTRDMFSPPRQSQIRGSPMDTGMACEPDDAPLFSRRTPEPAFSPAPTPFGNGFADDGGLECWVLVFGLGADDAQSALAALAQHGDVLEHERGAGNWLFARFVSQWQAEALLARRSLVLGDGRTVVGALRLDDEAAQRFGFRGGGAPAPAPAPRPAPDNLILHPRLRRPDAAGPRNCCENLVAAVFSW